MIKEKLITIYNAYGIDGFTEVFHDYSNNKYTDVPSIILECDIDFCVKLEKKNSNLFLYYIKNIENRVKIIEKIAKQMSIENDRFYWDLFKSSKYYNSSFKLINVFHLNLCQDYIRNKKYELLIEHCRGLEMNLSSFLSVFSDIYLYTGIEDALNISKNTIPFLKTDNLDNQARTIINKQLGSDVDHRFICLIIVFCHLYTRKNFELIIKSFSEQYVDDVFLKTTKKYIKLLQDVVDSGFFESGEK